MINKEVSEEQKQEFHDLMQENRRKDFSCSTDDELLENLEELDAAFDNALCSDPEISAVMLSPKEIQSKLQEMCLIGMAADNLEGCFPAHKIREISSYCALGLGVLGKQFIKQELAERENSQDDE